MLRPLSVALIAGVCLALTARAEDKLPPMVKVILDKAVREVKKNRDEFAKANAKPLAEAKKAMEDQAKKLIEEGKADEATAILGQVKMLEANVMKMANAPAPVAGGAGAQKPLLERLEGRWRRGGNNDGFVITPDGFVRISNGDQGKLVPISPEVVEVVLKSGWKLRFLTAQEHFACALEWNPQGQQTPGFVLERIK